MTTTSYILTGGAGTDTHIDLGLKVGTLSLEGQSFQVSGSEGDNSFFLRPAGYSFEFTDNAGGDDKIYLTGERADYVVTISDDIATLARGSGDTEETVKVATNVANMTLVFSDGFLLSSALTAGSSDSLNNSEVSGNPQLPATNSGGVRVGTLGTVDQTNVLGLSGPTFEAIGNGGIDRIFAAAGSSVDATKLGVGKDEIYLEGNWEDYTTAIAGTQITLTRDVVDPLSSVGATYSEEIKVIGGIGASDDRLLFADGSVDTRDLLLALRTNSNVNMPDENTWDSSSTSFSSAVQLSGTGAIALDSDTGTLADGVTSDGQINVTGIANGYVWQFSTDSGTTWQDGTGSSFNLSGQASGESGRTYDTGSVLVRQVNPFGVVSDTISNADAIVIDTIATAPVFSMAQYGLELGASGGGSLSKDVNVTAANGVTLQYWVLLDSADIASSSDQQLAFGPASAVLRDGKIHLWDGSAYQESSVSVAEGWNFISLSRASSNLEVFVVNESSPGGVTDSVTREALVDGNATLKVGQNGADAAPLAAVIRDLRIWDDVRDQSSVVADSAATLDGTESDLLSHWSLAEPTSIAPQNSVTAGGTLTLSGDAASGGNAAGYAGGSNIYFSAGEALISGGGAAPFADIEVFYSDGTEVSAGTVKADADGNWQLQFATALTPGDYSVRVEQTDLAGNAASSTASIRVSGEVPNAPDLAAASDSGIDTDNVTNDATPTITGGLPAGTALGDSVAIVMNGVVMAEATNATPTDGLTVNYGALTWSYEPTVALADGDYGFALQVGGVPSSALNVTIDTTAPAVPVITDFPALIETATFVGGNIVVKGTLTSDVSSLVVTWDDGDVATTSDPQVEATINTETNAWTATFTQAQMEAMTDGDALTFSLAAKDLADNEAGIVTSDAVVLEMVNETPTRAPTSTVPHPALTVTVGEVGGPGGTELLNLNDLNGNALFIDPDAAGSNNAQITIEGLGLPSWLEVTADGSVRLVEGESVPNLGSSGYTLQLRAYNEVNPSSGAGGIVNITSIAPLELTSQVDGVTELDAQSAIALESAADSLAYTTVEGTYKIKLIQLADAAGKSGFLGENVDGSQEIVVEVSAEGSVSGVQGGSITFSDGKAIVTFDGNFDLSNNFGIEVDSGLFVGATHGESSEQVGPGDITFATVTPSTDGEVSKYWDGTNYANGSTWYDGSSGNYLSNDQGLTVDLSGIAGTVVVGRDTTADDTIVLETGLRATITGFGADDVLYIDQDASTSANRVDEETIGFGNNDGAVPTHLLFSTAPENPQGAAIITFADDATTSEVDESGLFAIAFTDSALGSSAGVDHSFEGITGNATPVISG